MIDGSLYSYPNVICGIRASFTKYFVARAENYRRDNLFHLRQRLTRNEIYYLIATH